ncbi:CLUMA_CG003427, isoform A [Clunio marinus]|uniref:CLUMA_CG003427, isoform A n=1 Tax=Clunio marinus TaxID=568069 RepID=A0A1J1HQE2_9DIPT|nr:CLUMA_CG003427, isoform A [Clunio marinus]
MFNRPRCRDFEPLVTAQIRLRNLIKLSVVNIHCSDDKNSLIYFTLHLSAFSKPFYTSEKKECRKKVEWSEIYCHQIQNSSHRFICIRVWLRDNKRKLHTELTNDSSADKMLFLWGVYFSGLVSISNREDLMFKDNTILFHLFDEIFTSPDQIVFNTIPETQTNCDQNSDKYSSSPSVSITNGSNNHHNVEQSISTPPNSIDSNPNSMENETVTVIDAINEIKHFKTKYVKLDLPKNEVQLSYTVDKLLQIQDLQRRIKQKHESSKLLADRICTKSAACLNLQLIMRKPVFYEPQKQPGMGKTLSRLLLQQQAPPKPEIILKAHDLRLKMEAARFRIKLLTQERDKSRQYNRSLEYKREKLKDENTEKETLIWNSLRTLSRENLKTHLEKLILQREVFINIKLALNETKRCLLKELNDIYTIKKNSRGQYTINNIHLPDAESYVNTIVTPTDVSVALGYVAHVVIIVAKILNIPLRNPIKHEGSRSRIIDNVKILADAERTFPLFCRATPPPNVLLYAVYLLNQNISQLKHVIGLHRGDLRATLANTLDLLNSSNCEVLNQQIVGNFNPKQHNDNSTSSVDSVPIPISLNPSSARVSRSLDDFDDVLDNLNSKLNLSAPDLTSPINEQSELI